MRDRSRAQLQRTSSCSGARRQAAEGPACCVSTRASMACFVSGTSLRTSQNSAEFGTPKTTRMRPLTLTKHSLEALCQRESRSLVALPCQFPSYEDKLKKLFPGSCLKCIADARPEVKSGHDKSCAPVLQHGSWTYLDRAP